jgi:hypothetical protein
MQTGPPPSAETVVLKFMDAIVRNDPAFDQLDIIQGHRLTGCKSDASALVVCVNRKEWAPARHAASAPSRPGRSGRP